jgi:hypothetical protein
MESNITKILFRSFTGAPMTVILANVFIYSEIPIQSQRCTGKQTYYYSRIERENKEIPIHLYECGKLLPLGWN